VRDAVEQPRELVRRLDLVASERAETLIAVSTERAAAARRVTWVVALVGIGLTAALALWIGRTTARPLSALTRGAEAMAAGEFDHRVEVSSPRELALLARDFNSLAERLGELDRMKRDFLSSVSHDLKAPLASIQETTLLVLERGAGLEAGDRHLLELSARSAERLEGMIGDLLDIARLEAGAVTYQPEPLGLSGCCEEALDRAAPLLAHKDLAVESSFAAPDLTIRADLPLLLQALGNLLSNAAKFSPAGGLLRLKTRSVGTGERPSRARIELEDEGPGVPEADKQRIFDRFYTTPADTSRPAGTGLGLAIARSIVEHHGGRIWVEDGARGGSVFIVELPLAQRSDRRASEPAPE
jgi:two-component system sensor histidine kinase GlrK